MKYSKRLNKNVCKSHIKNGIAFFAENSVNLYTTNYSMPSRILHVEISRAY